MTYQPVIPVGGFAGWAFLGRTMDAQMEAFAASPINDRDMAYFRENIGQVLTAEDLVKDYRLLRVALGAFGLQDDLPNKAYIRTILEQGTSDDDALANRLADKRYQDFSSTFQFGPGEIPRTLLSSFADTVLDRFQRQEFERAVGEQNGDLRIALNLERELPEIASQDQSNDAAWFTVMGNPPLRAAFETALGLPETFGLIDLDQQLETFKDRARSILGTDQVSEIATEDGIQDVIRNYLGRAEIAAVTNIATPAAIAVTLLAPLAR